MGERLFTEIPGEGLAEAAFPFDLQGFFRVDKVRPSPYFLRLLRAPRDEISLANPWVGGGVAERSMAADCKSADVRLRRFESYPLHQPFARPGSRLVGPSSRQGAREPSVEEGMAGAGVAQW